MYLYIYNAFSNYLLKLANKIHGCLKNEKHNYMEIWTCAYGLLALPIGKRQCINGVRFAHKVLAPT